MDFIEVHQRNRLNNIRTLIKMKNYQTVFLPQIDGLPSKGLSHKILMKCIKILLFLQQKGGKNVCMNP